MYRGHDNQAVQSSHKNLLGITTESILFQMIFFLCCSYTKKARKRNIIDNSIYCSLNFSLIVRLCIVISPPCKIQWVFFFFLRFSLNLSPLAHRFSTSSCVFIVSMCSLINFHRHHLGFKDGRAMQGWIHKYGYSDEMKGSIWLLINNKSENYTREDRWEGQPLLCAGTLKVLNGKILLWCKM